MVTIVCDKTLVEIYKEYIFFILDALSEEKQKLQTSMFPLTEQANAIYVVSTHPSLVSWIAS